MFYYFNGEMKYYIRPYIPPTFADGSDEEAAVDALVALILGGFNE